MARNRASNSSSPAADKDKAVCGVVTTEEGAHLNLLFSRNAALKFGVRWWVLLS